MIAVLLEAIPLAHSIGVTAADESVASFGILGMEHMMLGWDHLLFIAGVVLLAGTIGRAAKLISLFVAGHSLTLIVATLAGWRLDATLVDVTIALSIVFVGVLGLRLRPERWTAIGASIFTFGLVHGLGLSTRLQALGLPEEGLLARVIAFNVGVELGQLLAIASMIAAVELARRARVDTPSVRRGAYGGLVIAGLIAAAVLSFTALSPQAEESRAAADGPCVEGTTAPPRSSVGDHPPKVFYELGDSVPQADLDHVTGDGFVIVRYEPSLAEGDRAALARWVADPRQFAVVAPRAGQESLVQVTTATRTLTCSRWNLERLDRFAARWLADVRAGRTG